MSDKGRGKSRGRAGQRQSQPGPSQQQLPHAQLSSEQLSSTQVSHRPGKQATQPIAITSGRGVMQRPGGKGDSAVAQIGRGVGEMGIQPVGAGGDAGAGASGTTATVSTGRGAARGKRILPMDIFVTKPAHIVNKKGSSGSHINLRANYFKLITSPDWCIYQYRVDFAPEEDRTFVRKGLLRLHREKIGAYIFDGTVLYTSNRLPEKMELLSTRQSDSVHIRITVRIVGTMVQGDQHYIQFFNIIMRKCLTHLKLQLVGRNYFDARNKVCLPEHRLELWPGYLTSIRQHESSILMCAEITNKVMRQETLFDILNDCYKTDGQRYRATFASNVIGTVVLTDYNNNTYRIEDVDFSTTPASTFPMKDGTMVAYTQYYQNKYGIRIKNATQPMLLTRNKPKDRQADKGDLVYLVPELCRATGLTDAMRENFSVMKSLAVYTRVNPDMRINKLKMFNDRLHNEPDIVQELGEWNMTLDKNLLEIPGRVLPAERLLFGGNAAVTANNGDWSREMQNKRCLVVQRLQDWVLIVSERDRRNVQNFVDTLLRVSQGISFRVDQPKICPIRDDRPSAYSEFLEDILSKQTPQLIFCVLPNNRSDRYSAIKKKCCVDRPIPSQVYLQKNLTHKNVMSIATKVAIQMNCKLGGAPWRVDIPLDGLMVVGFDVCHDVTNPGKDYGAMVASMDKDLTKYYSTINLHADGNELSYELASNICKAALMYRNLNNSLPSRIVIYRDGVGEGQISHVMEREIVDLQKKLCELYGGNDKYRMAFVIVTKRLNTRFFQNNKTNPPPGTVVDDVVTSPIKYDFFVVSQQVRQGTITPTSYNIVYDNLGLEPDKMQRLTYKLTHMYFNCSNTVRVPAPCHYAHKLAFLEISKDDKYLKIKPIIPVQYEPFKIYEDKKEEPVFKIYEDKLEEETSVVLRDSKEKKETKVKQETMGKTDRESPRLEIRATTVSNLAVFHDSMEDIHQKGQDNVLFLEDSPMSLEKSLTYSNSSKKELRTRRESSRGFAGSFFDVDEYRADIYNYLRMAETVHRPKPGYMKKQPDITYSMRCILVDWLVEVSEEYRLQTETLYLAVSYIDRFLSYMSVVRLKLQLVGTAAMLIAAKYEEIYAPDVGEFAFITDDTYTKKQVLRMENLILKVLAFDLSVPTPLVFLTEYCISNNLSDKIKFLAMYLCELSLLEANPYLQYLPSHLAASAVALARHTLQEEIWPHELELSTGYNLRTLKECIAHLNRTFCNAPNMQQQAIQEKYRNSKYGHVSLLLPRSTEAVSCEDASEEESA